MALGFYLPGGQVSAAATDLEGAIATKPWMAPTDGAGAEVNAWLLIAPDDTVTIRVAMNEMGTGVFTSMPMIIAEELQCHRHHRRRGRGDGTGFLPAWRPGFGCGH